MTLHKNNVTGNAVDPRETWFLNAPAEDLFKLANILAEQGKLPTELSGRELSLVPFQEQMRGTGGGLHNGNCLIIRKGDVKIQIIKEQDGLEVYINDQPVSYGQERKHDEMQVRLVGTLKEIHQQLLTEAELIKVRQESMGVAEGQKDQSDQVRRQFIALLQKL
ncbi:MAG: hypothetical protein Q7R81_04770 [Candidatus Peregrinibacteria bacterium]|nr:hypothetical protein [Candidatus Peregrinibacteria bacterium]